MSADVPSDEGATLVAIMRELFWLAYDVQNRAENPWPSAPSPAQEVWDLMHELIELPEAAPLVLQAIAPGAVTEEKQGYLGASLVEDYLHGSDASDLRVLERLAAQEPLLRLSLRYARVDPDEDPIAHAWLKATCG